MPITNIKPNAHNGVCQRSVFGVMYDLWLRRSAARTLFLCLKTQWGTRKTATHEDGKTGERAFQHPEDKSTKKPFTPVKIVEERGDDDHTTKYRHMSTSKRPSRSLHDTDEKGRGVERTRKRVRLNNIFLRSNRRSLDCTGPSCGPSTTIQY